MASKASILALIDSTRVRLGFGREKAFVPTANVRNPHMLEEAEAFSLQLKDFQRAVADYHRNVQGFMHGMLPLLDANLPRVWTAVPDSVGLAEPVAPAISHGHPGRTGGDYDGAAIMAHMDTLERGMKEEILAPLRRWQEGLQVARERMKSLDKLRREVDGQRKKFEKKFRRSEQRLRKAYLGAGYGSSSSSDSDDDDVVPRGKLLEDYQRLALHTERQLRAIVESYEDQERLVWEQLSGLVCDAAWLESYAAGAMIKVKEAMQGVALALGPSKQPLPAYRPKPGVPVGVPYGDIGNNVNLIKQMSPRALELASGSLPRGAAILPYQPLRAKRGTATPLLVAATAAPGSEQRRLASQPVPPVMLGASMVPIESMPRDVANRAIRDVERRVAGVGIRVHERPSSTFMPGAASPIVSTPTTAGTAAGGGFSTGGFRDSDRGTGFRESGRDRDSSGFRDTAREGLGFRGHEHQGSAGYRDQGFGSQREPEGLKFPHRELSLAQGLRDAELAPTAAGAAAADDTPRDRGVLSNAARTVGPDTPAPLSRDYADGGGQEGFGTKGTRLEYESAAAAAGGGGRGQAVSGERGYTGDRFGFEGGRRADDDVMDSYSSSVKMTPLNTNATPTTGPTPPASPGRSLRNITHAITTEIAQAHNNTPTPCLISTTDTIAPPCGLNTSASVNSNNLRSFPLTAAAATSPAYPPAARVGGVGSRNGSENEFQDARSEPYTGRGTSTSGYEAPPATGMNDSTARGHIADAPYGAGSPRDVGGLTKHQQEQAYNRSINSVQ